MNEASSFPDSGPYRSSNANKPHLPELIVKSVKQEIRSVTQVHT